MVIVNAPSSCSSTRKITPAAEAYIFGIIFGWLYCKKNLIKDKKVAIFGLTFKPGTADFRDSPAMSLGLYLSKAGVEVRATDPALDQAPKTARDTFELFTDPAECAVGSDAVVLATAWSAYQGLNWADISESMSGDLVVDGRNVLDVGEIKSAGLRYVGAGRGSVSD